MWSFVAESADYSCAVVNGDNAPPTRAGQSRSLGVPPPAAPCATLPRVPPNPIRSSVLTVVLSALAWAAAPARAQEPASVLLVVNTASDASVQVGEHYARLRGLPDANVLRLAMPATEEVTREQYLRAIEAPIARWFAREAAHDRILFLVLAKGVPLRVAGTTGRQGTVASVDSELAVLYRKMTGRAVPPAGPVPNPYFLGDRPLDQARPFARANHDIYLVTRLDGFTADEAKALATRGQEASARAAAGLVGGRVALDMKAAIEDRANEWLRAASTRLGEMGLGERVLLETTSALVRDQSDLLGYYSWGSNDPSMKDRSLGLGFVPGAIAGQYVSSDARTFVEPPATWTLGTWENRASYYAGSPQSLAGDLVRAGVSGISAQVAEPYLDAAVRPDVLFPAYLSGLTLAEAYYLALPSLSWQAVIVGDPLARVAPPRAAPPAVDTAIDPATQLPVLFSKRRLEAVMGPGLNAEAVKAMLRWEVLSAREDKAGARKALEEAVAADPKMPGPRLALAQVLEGEGDHEGAIARYREVLAVSPNNVVALNNLAFAVATYGKAPADALPLAERAYTLSRGDPTVADTVGWVHHLLGNRAQAARYVGEALRGAGDNGEIRLHAAVILAGAGDVEGARRELARALELEPALEQRRADLVAVVRALK